MAQIPGNGYSHTHTNTLKTKNKYRTTVTIDAGVQKIWVKSFSALSSFRDGVRDVVNSFPVLKCQGSKALKSFTTILAKISAAERGILSHKVNEMIQWKFLRRDLHHSLILDGRQAKRKGKQSTTIAYCDEIVKFTSVKNPFPATFIV